MFLRSKDWTHKKSRVKPTQFPFLPKNTSPKRYLSYFSHTIKHSETEGRFGMKKQAKQIFWNAMLLTAGALLVRTVGVSFQVYISNRAGAEAMGLFSLMSGVYGFALTLATSGIHLGVTHVVVDAMGSRNSASFSKRILPLSASKRMADLAESAVSAATGTQPRQGRRQRKEKRTQKTRRIQRPPWWVLIKGSMSRDWSFYQVQL